MNIQTHSISYQTKDNKLVIEITVNNYAKTIDELNDLIDYGKQLGKNLVVEIKKEFPHRSLNANSYMWVLVGQIADALRTSKDEIYIRMLTDYGQREQELIRVAKPALQVLERATNNHCCVVDVITTADTVYYDVAILRGSSSYNSKEMATLLDGVISEAQALGISVDTPSKIALYKERWGSNG